MDSDISNYTLKAHSSGVNCIEFAKNDKPIMLSGGDDFMVIVWDLSSKTILQKLVHHEGNVTGVAFLSTLPFFISLSEDGKINFYNSKNF